MRRIHQVIFAALLLAFIGALAPVNAQLVVERKTSYASGGGGGLWSGGDIANATFADELIGLANPSGVAISSDGFTLFYLYNNTGVIYQRPLSTAFDLSTAGAVASSYTASVGSRGIFLKPDGTRLYYVDANAKTLRELVLSTPYSLTGASAGSSFNVGVTPSGMYWQPDGSAVYHANTGNRTIYKRTASTPWSLTGLGSATTHTLTGASGNFNDMWIGSDGVNLYAGGAAGDTIERHLLSTAWDISTATYQDSLSVSAYDANMFAFAFDDSGEHVYLGGVSQDDLDHLDVPALP